MPPLRAVFHDWHSSRHLLSTHQTFGVTLRWPPRHRAGCSGLPMVLAVLLSLVSTSSSLCSPLAFLRDPTLLLRGPALKFLPPALTFRLQNLRDLLLSLPVDLRFEGSAPKGESTVITRICRPPPPFPFWVNSEVAEVSRASSKVLQSKDHLRSGCAATAEVSEGRSGLSSSHVLALLSLVLLL